MSEQQKRIIYIDDDYQAGLLAKIFLQRAGFEVLLSLNTKEARKILANEPVDMIITDVGLPVESGLDFYEWLQTSKYKDIPVLLVSAHAMGFSEILVRHRDIFFEKPIFFPQFIEHIKNTFGQN